MCKYILTYIITLNVDCIANLLQTDKVFEIKLLNKTLVLSHFLRCNRVQVPQQTKPAAGGRKTTVRFFLFSNYIRSSVV